MAMRKFDTNYLSSESHEQNQDNFDTIYSIIATTFD